jgi:hypothetical protein
VSLASREADVTDKGDKQRTDCSHTRESGLDVEFTNVCRTYALKAGFSVAPRLDRWRAFAP